MPAQAAFISLISLATSVAYLLMAGRNVRRVMRFIVRTSMFMSFVYFSSFTS